MIIHKNTKLDLLQRKNLYDDYYAKHMRKCDLIKKSDIKTYS